METADDLERAREAFVRGELVTAADSAKRAFQAAKAGGDPAAIGRARAMTGHVAYDELRYGAAREAYGIACRELEQSLGAEHDDTRQARASLALVLHCLGDTSGAAVALSAAASGLEAPSASMDPSRCETWVCIACAYASEARHADERRILEVLAGAVPETLPPLLATVHLHLAGALERMGDRSAALEHGRRCLELRTRAFGADNPRAADAALAVARTLAAMGRVEEAHRLAVEAIDCMRRLGLERRPRMSTGWATLGLTTLLGGDVRGGTEHLETACKIEEKTFGATHASTAGMLVMLAQVHSSLGDHGKVAGLCKRIVPVLKDAPGQEGPLVMACEVEARALSAMGRAREAAQRISDCIDAISRRRGGTSEQMARLYAALGGMELGSGRRERGIAALTRARALAIEAEGADSDLARELTQTLAMIEGGARPVPEGSA